MRVVGEVITHFIGLMDEEQPGGEFPVLKLKVVKWLSN